ncbi:hypothetical protein E2C01_006317 [Portunus trituberculatus]|uniref:Uncharacterized protein n=1 Tax=Portunus trituberculatus TaxID=210409 RepID=A0A5B7CW03_PORTR|nr:hypothetical protein [Portunus trituberculatus]
MVVKGNVRCSKISLCEPSLSGGCLYSILFFFWSIIPVGILEEHGKHCSVSTH